VEVMLRTYQYFVWGPCIKRGTEMRKKFTLEQATNAQRGFFNLDARCRCIGKTTPRAAFLARQRDPLRHVQEPGWAPG